jgi:hypothetical protein
MRIALIHAALDGGAAGILYTCSAFGEAIEAVQRASTKRKPPIPVLTSPDSAVLAMKQRLS